MERNICSASVPEMLPVPSRRAFTRSSTLVKFSQSKTGKLWWDLLVLAGDQTEELCGQSVTWLSLFTILTPRSGFVLAEGQSFIFFARCCSGEKLRRWCSAVNCHSWSLCWLRLTSLTVFNYYFFLEFLKSLIFFAKVLSEVWHSTGPSSLLRKTAILDSHSGDKLLLLLSWVLWEIQRLHIDFYEYPALQSGC